jgi:hypothetical protein
MPDFKTFQKASEKASGFATQVKERATDKLSDTMDSGFGKLNSVLDDLNSALPVLQEAGYPSISSRSNWASTPRSRSGSQQKLA